MATIALERVSLIVLTPYSLFIHQREHMTATPTAELEEGLQRINDAGRTYLSGPMSAVSCDSPYNAQHLFHLKARADAELAGWRSSEEDEVLRAEIDPVFERLLARAQ